MGSGGWGELIGVNRLLATVHRSAGASPAVAGKLANWPTGKLENWETGQLANWKTGKLANWKTGKLENWPTGKLENGLTH